MQVNCTLTSINLSGTYLGALSVAVICEALKVAKAAEVLWPDRRIGERTIASIDLGSNCIGAEGVAMIGDMLKAGCTVVLAGWLD